MRSFAFYGKGGMGKSTVTTNVASALSEQGYKVMVIGCDPKADCTSTLHAGVKIKPFLDFLKERAGIELFKQIGVFEEYSPDIVLFDVLGDMVCGGLALPLRRGLAQ